MKKKLQTSVHLPIFWTLCALPEITTPIPKYIPRSVGIVTNSFHSFRKTVVILRQLRSNAKWAKWESAALKDCSLHHIATNDPFQMSYLCKLHTETEVLCFEMTTCNRCLVVGAADNYNTMVTIRALRPSKKPLPPLPLTIYRPPKIYHCARASWFSRDGGASENLVLFYFTMPWSVIYFGGFLTCPKASSLLKLGAHTTCERRDSLENAVSFLGGFVYLTLADDLNRKEGRASKTLTLWKRIWVAMVESRTVIIQLPVLRQRFL